MRWTEARQGVRMIKFRSVLDRYEASEFNQIEAAELLGIPLEKKRGGDLIPAEEKTKGSGKYKGFKVSTTQLQDIAKRKLQDLNARDLDHAVRIVAGTARSMGLTVEG